jgi:hypothetical protein
MVRSVASVKIRDGYIFVLPKRLKAIAGARFGHFGARRAPLRATVRVMSDQKDADGDAVDDATEAEDEERDSEEPKPASQGKPPKGSAATRRTAKARATRGEEPARGAGRTAATATAGRIGLIAVAALALGAAGGWFAHDAHAKAELRKEAAPAPAGSGAAAGPCGDWKHQICSSSGEDSAACQQAKDATDLLTPSACEVALEAVPATLVKLKAARASCDTLVAKLCKDLPEGSQACELVKGRTPSFPASRCAEMLGKYDQVIGELKMLDQQMGQSRMGGGPHGAGPGAMPPGGGMPPPGGGMPPPGGGMPPPGAHP